MDKKMLMKGLCAPTVLGAIIGTIGVIQSNDADERKKVLSGYITLVLILWVLCYYGYIRTAWVLLLLPVILWLLLVLGVLAAIGLGGGGSKSMCGMPAKMY